MDEKKIKDKVKELLEICGDDPARIQEDIDRVGDAEIDSIYFVEIAPQLAQEYGITITPNHIDQYAKRSFNNFCEFLENLVTEQR